MVPMSVTCAFGLPVVSLEGFAKVLGASEALVSVLSPGGTQAERLRCKNTGNDGQQVRASSEQEAGVSDDC